MHSGCQSGSYRTRTSGAKTYRPQLTEQAGHLSTISALEPRFRARLVANWCLRPPGYGGSLRWALEQSLGVVTVAERRRRANVTGGRRHSWQVTASDEEAAALVVKAEQARKTVPALLFDAAMAEGRTETLVVGVEIRDELTAIRNMMRALGNNVNQLAKHANATGEFPAEAHAAITAVQRTAARINDTLLELGQR